MQIESEYSVTSQKMHQLLIYTALVGAVVVIIIFFARSLLLLDLDEVSAACGVIALLLNLKLIAFLGQALLCGVDNQVRLVSVISFKVILFFLIVALLSRLPSPQLYSFLAGFLSLIPAALLLGIRQR